MSAIWLLILFFLTFFVFAVPKCFKYWFTLLLLTGGIVLTSLWSLPALTGSNLSLVLYLDVPLIQKSLALTID